MTVDLDFFAKLRTVHPEFPAVDALAIWLEANPDQAVRIARSNGPDPFFDKRELKMKLNEMDGYDAFMLAYRSDFGPEVDVFWFNEWGQLESANLDEMGRICKTYVLRNLADRIIDGRADVPSELMDILGLWDTEGDYAGSRNVKRRRH